MAAFNRIVRFRDRAGAVFYGEVDADKSFEQESLAGQTVPVYQGAQPWDKDFALTGEKRVIAEVSHEIRSESCANM